MKNLLKLFSMYMRNIKIWKAILCSVFLSLLLSFHVTAEVTEHQLDNGLKVLITEDHKAPIATFQLWYKVGARNEPAGKTGISHLLEHMMFKGTKKYGSKVFSRIVQRNGGIDNAYTTKDYTMYFQTMASDRIGLSIELEADRMQNLLLDSDDVKFERSVVMEERRLRYEDDPQRSLYEEIVATAFKVHPYQNPVIGWMSNIASIEREDLRSHYRKFYAPDNAIIVIAGDVHTEETMDKINVHFGSIPKGLSRGKVLSEEPPQRGQKRVVLRKEAKLPFIMAAFHVPRFPHEDAAPLEVLGSILSGKSGRLYRNIVRTKVALNVFSSYDSIQIDPYLFLLGGTPVPGKDVQELEDALKSEVSRIKADPPSEREVQKATNQVEASFIMGQDSIFSQAQLLGEFEMLGDWRMMDTYLDKIRRVTPEDVRRVAQKYFTEENMVVGILIPKEKS
jgi:zinc protease